MRQATKTCSLQLRVAKVQQLSTSYPHLIETEAAENRALLREAGNCLGHRCATLKRIFRFNNLEERVVELCGPFRKPHLQFRLHLPQ